MESYPLFFDGPYRATPGCPLLAKVTGPIDDHLDLAGQKAPGKGNRGDRNRLQTGGLAANITDEVDVIVVVVSLVTGLFTQSITDTVVRGGYRVNHPFFHKRLEGAVYGHPVELISPGLFHVSVRQRAAGLEK